MICLHSMCCGVSHLHNYMLVILLAKFRSILRGERLFNIQRHSNTLGDNLQVNSFGYYLFNTIVGCGRTCGEIGLRVLIFDQSLFLLLWPAEARDYTVHIIKSNYSSSGSLNALEVITVIKVPPDTHSPSGTT